MGQMKSPPPSFVSNAGTISQFTKRFSFTSILCRLNFKNNLHIYKFLKNEKEVTTNRQDVFPKLYFTFITYLTFTVEIQIQVKTFSTDKS